MSGSVLSEIAGLQDLTLRRLRQDNRILHEHVIVYKWMLQSTSRAY